jgi:carboxymethylenebutenolidase
VSRILVSLALIAIALAPGAAARQAAPSPEPLIVTSGPLQLRALLFRPRGTGPFPAVLFNHGSYVSTSPMPMPPDTAAIVGDVFAKHGYALLFLFRQGIGLSIGQGTADGDLMENAFKTSGTEAGNRVQLELLEGEELNEVTAALNLLRQRPDVDARRIAVVGHSFGGQLSLVLAERDARLRGAVLFGPAALSWERSPMLRTRVIEAARRAPAPLMIVHARNDYSVVPGQTIAAERRRLGKPHQLKMYPPFGANASDGHNMVFLSVPTWEQDVFAFLDPLMRR